MTAETDQAPGSAPADRARAAALAGSAAASAAVSAADAAPLADATMAEATLAWRWVVGTDSLDLYAVQSASPLWRATCVGAGGALHRARVALAADGLAAAVTLLPEAPDRGPERGGPPGRVRGGDPARRSAGLERPRRNGSETPYLARLVVTEAIEVTPEAVALYAATDPGAAGEPEAGTDAREALADDDGRPPPAGRSGGVLRGVRNRRLGGRRPGARRGPAPSRSVIRDLMNAARAEGVRLRLIRDGGGLVGLLHGPDTREAWLRAGMAASAVRLHARRHGFSTVTALATDHPGAAAQTAPDGPPDAAPVRAAWRRIGDREGWLSVGTGTPYLRLRLTPS